LLLLVPAARTLRGPGGPDRPPVASADGAVRTVRFELVAPGARRVTLVGDFNEWDPAATPLHAAGRGGVWSVEVPLHGGRYTYSFVVDGSAWRGDPAAPPAPEDDFGRPSSVILVPGET
ncbi:MAG TPA: isoamylase early set domain-containing protein, partial [Longimicrobiaceae bacterium]